MKPCGSNQVKIKEAQLKNQFTYSDSASNVLMENGPRTIVICGILAELLQLKVPKKS